MSHSNNSHFVQHHSHQPSQLSHSLQLPAASAASDPHQHLSLTTHPAVPNPVSPSHPVHHSPPRASTAPKPPALHPPLLRRPTLPLCPFPSLSFNPPPTFDTVPTPNHQPCNQHQYLSPLLADQSTPFPPPPDTIHPALLGLPAEEQPSSPPPQSSIFPDFEQPIFPDDHHSIFPLLPDLIDPALLRFPAEPIVLQSLLPQPSNQPQHRPPPPPPPPPPPKPQHPHPSFAEAQDICEILRNNEHCSEANAEKPTPPGMRVTLLKHQRQALAWMVEREQPAKPPGHPRGGILADDQGFGKTLSAIALIMHNKPPAKRPTHAAANLIVAPTSVLHQWAAEIRNHVVPQSRPRVLLYHGVNRRRFAATLNEYDVVITSYGVLGTEFPKVLERDEKRNPIVRRTRGPLYKLQWFRVVLDEAQAIKNFRSERFHAVKELDTIHKWSLTGTPIQNTIDDVYAQFLFLGYKVVETHREWVLKYKIPLEGSSRHSAHRKEVVIKKFQSILGVVLLRRAKSDKISGKAILELPSKTTNVRELTFTRTELRYYQRVELWTVRRMHNAGEAENQFAFTYVTLLRLRQACNHPALCEWESGTKFRFSDEELDVVEIRMSTKSLFKQLPKAVQERLYVALGPQATSEHAQQCPICMDIITADGIVTKCGHIFCMSDFEKWISTNDTCPFCRGNLSNEDEYMSLEGVRKEVHALERRRRRQKHKQQVEAVKKVDEALEQKVELSFSGKRCNEGGSNMQPELKKAHLEDDARSVCSGSSMNSSGSSEQEEDIQEQRRQKREKDVLSTRSTKIRAFIEDYRNIVDNTSDKALCFSQWTRMFDLLEVALSEEGYEYVRLDGTMSLKARQEAMHKFQTRCECRLFLISLNAGSTGLNLTNANRVFLLDSWWNPAVEDQAVDRVHRIGQTKQVFVTKYKIMDTVENKILQIQERKREIIDGALGVEGLKTAGRRRLTMRDLMWMLSDVAENVGMRAMAENNDVDASMANDALDFARSF